MKELELTQGQVALVDKPANDWLSLLKWCALYRHSLGKSVAFRNAARQERACFPIPGPRCSFRITQTQIGSRIVERIASAVINPLPGLRLQDQPMQVAAPSELFGEFAATNF